MGDDDRSEFAFSQLHADQKKLFGLLVASCLLTQWECLYGILQLDVGCIVDALQATFHTASLFISFYAMGVAKKRTSPAFSYGYGRSEVVAAFTNALFLTFTAVFVFVHLFHHSFSASKQHFSSRLSFHGLVRVVINVAGCAVFSRNTSMVLQRTWSRQTGGFTARDENIASVITQMLGDIIMCFTLVVAHLTSDARGLEFLEPLLSLVACLTMVWIAWPIFTATSRVLLQGVSAEMLPILDKALRVVSFSEGVLQLVSANFWSLHGSVLVGAIEVKVMAEADAQAVLNGIREVLAPHVTDLTVQITRDKPTLDWMASTPPQYSTPPPSSYGSPNPQQYGTPSPQHGASPYAAPPHYGAPPESAHGHPEV